MPSTGGSERNRNAGARPSAAAPRRPPPSRAEEAACGGFCSSSAILRPPLCPARGCPQPASTGPTARKEMVPERLPGRVRVRPRASAEADGEPGGNRLLDVSPAPGGCIWAFAQGLGSLGAFCERGLRVAMTSALAGSVLPGPGCSARSPGLHARSWQLPLPPALPTSFGGGSRGPGEGRGTPLQCSRLENPRDRGAWRAAVHRGAQSQAGVSD